IVERMAEGQRGVLIVTGPAGCGKSAVVGRIVSLSDPDERAEIVASGSEVPDGTDPGVGSVTANIHARGMTPELAFAAIAGQLGLEAGASVYELLGALSEREPTPTIVVDGLDEVGSEEEISRFVTDVITRLSDEALVVVASRSVTSPGQGIEASAVVSSAEV